MSIVDFIFSNSYICNFPEMTRKTIERDEENERDIREKKMRERARDEKKKMREREVGGKKKPYILGHYDREKCKGILVW